MVPENGRVKGLHHLFLPVSRFGEGWEFWTRILGLEARAEWGEGTGKAGMAGLGGAHVVVSGEPAGPSPEFGYASRHGVPQVFLAAEGLDALCAAVKGRGGKVLREPFRTHWGPRCFTVEGPDGLVVGFLED
jgi:predicted enzyme related to lactoylglutathione lyase